MARPGLEPQSICAESEALNHYPFEKLCHNEIMKSEDHNSIYHSQTYKAAINNIIIKQYMNINKVMHEHIYSSNTGDLYFMYITGLQTVANHPAF